ncbi:MAG TPA: adenylate/guanylate cyclase domain-containing protein [Leptospiraceae bacterium]|nr:guanylate cyclase [Spirochaetaceae bacterium]HBS06059.1 adenylate/guanylate cyclase domain-containing protein [Leptospiraceae bacterium]|tara:strand:+ start:4465 stop:5922 length:1458 start_codon:yes stop_codon:yes gene_type:complete
MNRAVLDQKFESLKSYASLPQKVLKTLQDQLPEMDDWELNRINPYTFARDFNLVEQEAVDTFVHAAKVGMFDFLYNLTCPKCVGIVHSHQELDQIEGESFHCYVCNLFVPTQLDDHVEVAFRIHQSVHQLSIDPLSNIESYFRYHFSPNFQKSTELLNWIESTIRGFEVLEPESSYSFGIRLTDQQPNGQGHMLQVATVDANSGSFFVVDKNAKDPGDELHIELLPSGFVPFEKKVPPGNYIVHVHNRTGIRTGTVYLQPNPEKIVEIATEHPTKVLPFLTARELLNNQSFRDLFRIQHLSPNLNLNIKSLTILFTDLRGSTEMYDQAGDLIAYRLVQDHFKELTDTVRHHKGAIVKTMGDAIMATFSRPIDGLLAALEMLNRLNSLNEKWKQQGYELGLKVGINEGPALAVMTDDRLDYFGQSVNVAARVQGLAGSGEVWITDTVWNHPGIEEIVSSQRLSSEQREATLKGVGKPTRVVRLTIP